MMIDALEMMKTQIETGYIHDPNGRLRCVSSNNKRPALRFLLGRTKSGNIRRFRYDLPENIVNQLDLTRKVTFTTDAPFRGQKTRFRKVP